MVIRLFCAAGMFNERSCKKNAGGGKGKGKGR